MDTLITLFVFWISFSLIEAWFKERYTRLSNVNLFKVIYGSKTGVYKVFHRLTHRPTTLQREIMQEEKEIKELERQKADMKRLDQLKERKNRLWEEVNPKDYEEKTCAKCGDV